MLSFKFGGKDSYIDFEITVIERPLIPLPAKRVQTAEIPGRNSTLHFDDGTYGDITIGVRCGVKDTNNLADRLDEIKSWLMNTGENDLIFDFQANKKYIAQVVNQIDFKQVFKVFGEFIIIFNCRPFKYSISNQVTTMLTPNNITNNGTINSEPLIKVYGTGDGILTVGTQVINLKGISGSIIIDSTIQDCYAVDGSNLNNKMSGEFPMLSVGINSITWTGGITKVDITPNCRWL